MTLPAFSELQYRLLGANARVEVSASWVAVVLGEHGGLVQMGVIE